MNLTIELPDDVGAAIKAEAQLCGLSPALYVSSVLVQKLHRSRKRPGLTELLAKCDPSQPFSEEDRIWLDSPPVGREV